MWLKPIKKEGKRDKCFKIEGEKKLIKIEQKKDKPINKKSIYRKRNKEKRKERMGPIFFISIFYSFTHSLIQEGKKEREKKQ